MYNEKNIKILTQEEKEQHSVISILPILIEEFPSTAPAHLEKIAAMIIALGGSVDDYRLYRKGMLSPTLLETWQGWFKENN
ncbi:hypothetical protein DH20_06730 [Pantoea agglomerans]|nr:hypothetical protein [Pantoea agglomerans]